MTSAMTHDVGIIACSKQKLAHAAPARELYVSQLFRMSLAYAERNCTSVHIVSAMHGLVELDDKLTPYDFEMSDRGGKRYQNAWGDRVAAALVAKHGQTFTTLMLCGELYARPIRGGLLTTGGHGPDGWRGRDRYPVVEPLKHMQIGQRLSWLSAQLRDASPGRLIVIGEDDKIEAWMNQRGPTNKKGKRQMKKRERQELMTEREFNERSVRALRRFTRKLKREATSSALQQQTTRLRQLWRIARSS